MTTNAQADSPVNDMRELYAVQHAVTGAGGELTPDVHKAIDALREVWDAELRRAQAEAHQYRTALQGVARHPAVSVLSPTRADDQVGLRDRIAETIAVADGWEWASGLNLGSMSAHTVDHYQGLADAVLAVLPPPAARAAVLREAEAKAREVVARLWDGGTTQTALDRAGGARAVEFEIGELAAQAELRRVADEEQQQGPWTADDRLKTHAIPAAAAPDGPSMTGGFDASIEIPDLAEAQQQPDTETPEVTWRVQTQRPAGHWTNWTGEYTVRPEARADFADTVANDRGRHAWRLVRFATTATVEAEHTPAVVSQPGKGT